MGISENFTLPGAQVLNHGTAGNSTTFVGYLPSQGVRSISIVVPITMGNAGDETITVKTADDASGTNPTVLTQNIPIYKDGVRATDAKAFTETAATGNFVYVFEVPASIIPEGKYIGVVQSETGSASSIYSAIAIEDPYYKG